jgi:hypothetical protein
MSSVADNGNLGKIEQKNPGRLTRNRPRATQEKESGSGFRRDGFFRQTVAGSELGHARRQ